MRLSLCVLFFSLACLACSGGGGSSPDPKPPGGDQVPPDQTPPPAPDAAVEAAKPEPACLKDKGGCDEVEDPEQLAVNECEAQVTVMTMADVAKKAKKLKGKTVVVRGPLNVGAKTCTAMACTDQECCNSCGSTLILGTGEPDGKTAFLLREAATTDAGGADGYDCKGDESLVCCKYPVTGQEVIVTGTLTTMTGTTPADPRLRVISGASICVRSGGG